jgi:septum formation protein
VQLILASASPRRRELLAQLGLAFTVSPADLDETPQHHEPPRSYVERLAREKALAVGLKSPADVALAADTSVVIDGVILGKPGDDEEAGSAMLRRLSGKTHVVMTGVAVATGAVVRSLVVETAVQFRSLTDAEVRWYVSTGEGRDKAGGYASQARAGAFITSLHGSSTSVIGLPLAETLELLQAAGFRLPWAA